MAILNNLTVFSRVSSEFVAAAIKGTVTHESSKSLAIGTGDGQADVMIHRDIAVVNNATPFVVDLTTAQDVSGAVRPMVDFVGWKLENLSDTAGEDFTVGGGANPVIPADGEVVQAKGGRSEKFYPNLGRPVAGGSKNFQIAVAAGANVAGRLTLIGRSA